MKKERTFLNLILSIITGLLILAVSCSKTKTPKIEPKSQKIENRVSLTIKNKEIEVEVAKTLEERALGLMFRKNMDWDTGMLFIFEEKGMYPFWMKNTGLPLSIAFVDENDIIIDILEMVPNQEVIRYSPSEPFMFALEMNQGWFIESGINIGDTIYGIP